MTISLHMSGNAQIALDASLPGLVSELLATRLFSEDSSLWGESAQAEAEIRLGWLEAVTRSRELVPQVVQLREELLARGITRTVLSGMGGSSLAPEVITRTSGVDLTILDSTAPDQVLHALLGVLSSTVLVVASKSGSTVETDSHLRAFVAAFTDLGLDPAEHVVVITDPDSPLHQRAVEQGYRVFLADPTVGGRYSALTAFGLVPSGLAGADISELLDEAEASMLECAVDSADNPALRLAAALAANVPGVVHRRDKMALVKDGTHIQGLPDWIEQLVAESTGKNGTGILPVVMLPVSPELESKPSDLQVVRLVDDAREFHFNEQHFGEILISGTLGAQFLLWECATSIIGRILGINPFDQPDVEAAKIAARGLLDTPPQPVPPAFVEGGIEVRASNAELVSSGTIEASLDALWAQLSEYGYVSIHAYANRIQMPQLMGLREMVAADSSRPTTFGWGPRFLHSTGQYHKGGPAQGVFLQIIEQTDTDVEIPGRPYTFGQLMQAQAAGDAAVLAAAGRPVLTLTITDSVDDILALFTAAQ